MRRNWLVGAALAAAAISVPAAALGGTVLGGTAQAATTSAQQQPAAASPAAASAAAPRKLKKVTPAKKAAPKKAPVTFDHVAAALAKTLVGDPYASGGTSPAGFDCSGLTQYVYRHTGRGKSIPRTADDQYHQFGRITLKVARPGDLVFFHDTTDLSSHVYHVGVYEGGDDMVAAATYGEGVRFQSFDWAGDTVTFGTITH
jgi:cell wall-associated NlpC family hydrolase